MRDKLGWIAVGTLAVFVGGEEVELNRHVGLRNLFADGRGEIGQDLGDLVGLVIAPLVESD